MVSPYTTLLLGWALPGMVVVEPFVPLAACIIAAVLFIVERQSRICSPGISHLTDSPSPHHGQGLIGDLAVC